MDSNNLKQYLLLFDSVTFLDAVADEDWRAFLYRDLEKEYPAYSAYRNVADAMPWLRKEGVVKIVSPSSLAATNSDLTVAATISDLADPTWVTAADPRRFHLPTLHENGAPSWQIFRPKIPKQVEQALVELPEFGDHLLQQGNDLSAWELSYASGSSIGINVHLAAADELGLAPVTDSGLHHELMLRKLARNRAEPTSITQFKTVSQTIAQRTIFNVISEILPPEKLAMIAIQDVLEFRTATKDLRREFVNDIGRIVSAETEIGKVGESEKIVAKITGQLIDSARLYGVEMAASRNKLWPKLIDGIVAPIPAATSAAALAASYITGSGYVLAASIILSALSPIRAGLEWKIDLNKASAARSAIAYISKVQQISRR